MIFLKDIKLLLCNIIKVISIYSLGKIKMILLLAFRCSSIIDVLMILSILIGMTILVSIGIRR